MPASPLAQHDVKRLLPFSARFLRGSPKLRAAVISLACLVVGLGVFLFNLGLSLDVYGEAGIDRLAGFFAADLIMGILACSLVGVARRSLPLNGLIALSSLVSSLAGMAGVLAIARLGERRSRAINTATVVVLTFAGTAFFSWQDAAVGERESIALNALVAALIPVAALLWGNARASRTALTAAIVAQAESTQAAREAEIERVRADERTALAREMHDGISHQLSIIAMHTGAIAYRQDLSLDQQRASAMTARDASARAGEMLHEVLSALRRSDRSTAPSPTPADIHTLISKARSDGLSATLEWSNVNEEALQEFPATTHALVRAITELLNNAKKYAAKSELVICLEKSDGAIVLLSENETVERPSDDAPPLGTGHGLLGIQERVSLLGGTSRYGRTSDGTFRVRLEVPLR